MDAVPDDFLTGVFDRRGFLQPDQQLHAQHAADHKNFGVREVDEFQNAVDHRVPERDHRVNQSQRDTVHNRDRQQSKKQLWGHALSLFFVICYPSILRPLPRVSSRAHTQKSCSRCPWLKKSVGSGLPRPPRCSSQNLFQFWGWSGDRHGFEDLVVGVLGLRLNDEVLGDGQIAARVERD